MLIRAISGLVYVAVIVGALLGGGLWTCALALILAALASMEFTNLMSRKYGHNATTAMTDVAATLCLAAAPTGIGLILWVILLLARMAEELYIKNEDPVHNLALSVFGQIYIGLPAGLLMCAGVLDYTSSAFTPFPTREILNVVLAMFVLIWLNDTGAYLVGSRIGRTKMWERISPKKTWEGFFGGVVFCIAGAIGCHFIMPGADYPSIWAWAGLGIVVAIFATWGDLVESLFKRTLGVKDSGHLIPGHGGILDRIDSFLMVMPATAVYLLLTLII